MKLLLLISLFSNSILAFTEMTYQESLELKKRAELYGLTKVRPVIAQKNLTEYDNTVVKDLQKEIHTNYIPTLEYLLGKCEDEDCLVQNNDYKILKFKGKTVCLPYTQCGFYKCMENKYQCKKEGVDYFSDLAFPTCSTYRKNINKKYFTQKGYEWIYSVMVCLQKGLVQECDINNNCQKETAKKTCDHITEFTLNFHPGCYLNSSVGVCALPLKDKINIWRTVGKFLTDRERQEAMKVVLACIRKENNR